jgi:hypothetical protein
MKNEIERLTNERAEREREASEASVKLETARAAYKTERSPAAYKALEPAHRESERAKLALEGVIEALEQAQAAHAEAEHAAQVAAYERALSTCAVDAFRSYAAPIAKRLAELTRETAELSARGVALSADFTSKRTALASVAREVGLTPAPMPAFAKIFGAESALAAGKTPSEALALFFGVEAAPDVDPRAQLALVYHGEDPREVSALLAQLRGAENRRAFAVRKVLAEGSGLGSNSSPTPLGSFLGVTAECEGYRTRLSELGFAAAADSISIDALAHELSAVDTQVAAVLIDKHKVADFQRASEELQRRDSKAAAAECSAFKLELARMGCPKLAAALPRASFGRGASAGGNAFASF